MGLAERRAVWVVAAMLASSTATAQGVPSARESYELGTRELEAHRYATAVEALETSYRLDPVPVVLFNLGLAHQGVGHLRAAIDAFERYAAQARDVPPARAEALRQRVEQLRAALCTLAFEGASTSARLLVDGREEPIVDGVARVDPGEHVVELRAAGRATMRQTMHLAPGTREVLRLELAPEPAPRVEPAASPAPPPVPTVVAPRADVPTPHPRAPAPSPSITSRWWFWTAIGAVAVGALVAGLAVGLPHTEAPLSGTSVDIETLTLRPAR